MVIPDQTSSSSPQSVFDWQMVRTALRAAEEGVYCWDIEHDKIHYTEQCLKMLGVRFNEIAPNVFTQPELTIHEHDLSFFQTELKRYLNWVTNTPMRLEIRLRNVKSRSWKWIRINGLVERDEQHQAKRLVGVWIDITRRKMTDMRANEDRELFRTLINHLPDSIYFKNKESRFVVANDATAKKMGVSTPSDLIGCTDRNFFDESMSNISRREELSIMESRQPITARLHRETWKGKEDTWSQISKFPWFDAVGQVRGVVGISSDVTKLVQAQSQYKKLAEHLDERNKALENEITLAREIQQALQPLSIPSRCFPVDGKTRCAHFHHVYMPSAGVAGDCFAVFPVSDKGIGMLICDVMGHGIRAALIASMLRGLMEQASSLADTPALILSTLNRQLYRIFSQANITMFTTACYVYLDLEKKRLTLSSAGHPAPLVIDADNTPYLPAIPRSPALGLLENTLFREAEIPMQSGMKLMLYTDGITEARNNTEDELGASRLIEYYKEHHPDSIKDMLNSSLTAMKKFTGDVPIDDDICLIGVEFEEHDIPTNPNSTCSES